MTQKSEASSKTSSTKPPSNKNNTPAPTFEENLKRIEKETLANPSKLAVDAANSAVRIAENVAALGIDETMTQALAKEIFDDSMQQIERIQNLYNLPKLNLVYPLSGSGD